MAGQSNFQDVVQLNQATLSFLGSQLQIGSAVGSMSVVFAQEPTATVSAVVLAVSAATGMATVVMPNQNGTIGLVTALAAGGNSITNGGAVFSNSNGVTFGINGSTITASVANGSTAPGGIAAGTQTATSGTVVFSNSNLVSFGMSNSSIVTASAGYVASISAGTTNATGNQVVFSNSNGVSFGANGATVTASVAAFANVVSGIGVSNIGNTLGNTGSTLGTVVFAGIGNITLSQATAGGSLATITISGSQSTAPAGLGVPGSTITNGTVVFSNSNNVSFGINGSTVTASVSGTIAQQTYFEQYADWNTNWSISYNSFSMQHMTVPGYLSATRAQILLAISGDDEQLRRDHGADRHLHDVWFNRIPREFRFSTVLVDIGELLERVRHAVLDHPGELLDHAWRVHGRILVQLDEQRYRADLR